MKSFLKKLGKCIGLGVLAAVINHASGDNNGSSLTSDVKVAVLSGLTAAIKTDSKKDEK